MKSNKMEKEIEIKLDLPMSLDRERFLETLELLLRDHGWSVESKRGDNKTITYYDNSNFDLHHNNSTLRRVESYTGKEGIYRYDFKIGQGLERREEKHRSNELLSSDQISDLFGISIRNLAPVVGVRISPILWNIRSTKGYVELKFETGELFDGQKFRELELELLDGRESSPFKISEIIMQEFGFKERNQQKYSRVLEMSRSLNGGYNS